MIWVLDGLKALVLSGGKRRANGNGFGWILKTKVKASGVSYAPEEYVKEQCWVALGRPH